MLDIKPMIHEYSKDHTRAETAHLIAKLTGIDASCFENDLEQEDGGPGSGNWGHKGRIGKRGGSGKGGGKHYRGGRSDVGFYGSKKDWLNGLSGERQHEAQKFMKRMKIDYGQPDDTMDAIEEKIMRDDHRGSLKVKGQLVGFMSEARGWDENASKLVEHNLDEDDKKILKEIEKKYGSLENGMPDDKNTDEWEEEDLRHWLDLKSKAMGGPTSGKEAPDELQYAAGLKEKPVEQTPEAQPDGLSERNRAINKRFSEWVSNPVEAPEVADAIAVLKTLKKGYTLENLKEDREKAKSMTSISPEYIAEAERQIAEAIFNDSEKGNAQYYSIHEKLNKYLKYKISAVGWENIEEEIEDGDVLSDSEIDCYNDLLKKYKSSNFKELENDIMEKFARAKTGRKQIDFSKDMHAVDYMKFKLLGGNPEYSPIEGTKKEKADKIEHAKQTDNEIRRGYDNRKGSYDHAVSKKIQESTTSRQIQDIMVNSGIFSKASPPNVKNMDLAVAKHTAEAYNKIATEYPFLRGWIEGVESGAMGENTLAKCNVFPSKGKITINRKFAKDSAEFNSEYERSVNNGYHPVGTHYDSTPVHELGHAIDAYLTRLGYGGSSFQNPFTRAVGLDERCEAAGVLQKRVWDAMGLTASDPYFMESKKQVSGYAEENSSEWFAECIAEYYCSETPRPMCVECVNQLKKMIKERR